MSVRPPRQTWRERVADLLDDPIAAAVLRRDGLTVEDVLAELAPVADRLNARPRPAAPFAEAA